MTDGARPIARLISMLIVGLFVAVGAYDLAPPRQGAMAQEAPEPADGVGPATPTIAPKDQIIIPIVPTATRTPTPINVGNLVWDDLDKDGRRDAGEPGLAGVAVQIWNSAKTQLIDSDVTNANGGYTLVVPTSGNYRVRAVLPGALDQFSPKDQAGGDDLLDSDINPTGTNLGFTDIYVFASNLISITTIDIGIMVYRPPTPTRTPTPINVGNLVWYDIDADGLKDAGEPGLGNITVQIWNSAKTQLIDSDVTNANGGYTLVVPTSGNYRVRVVPPLGAGFSPLNQGANDQVDSDINPTGPSFGFTDIYVFASNLISITTIDAGLVGVPATPTPTNTPLVTNTPTSTATSAAAPDAPVYLPQVTR